MGMIIRLAHFVGAFVVRLLLFYSPSFTFLTKRIEISTPLTSWIRVTEGVHLYDLDISPYKGSDFHEPPLALLAYWCVIKYAEKWIPLIFVVSDLLTAYFLMVASRRYLENLALKESKYMKNTTITGLPPPINNNGIDHAPLLVAAVYLFCPYSIASCVGKSTSVFLNLILALLFYFTITRKLLPAAAMLALATYQSLYPIILLVPVALYLQQGKESYNDIAEIRVLSCLWRTGICTVLSGAALMYLSYQLVGSFEFLWPIYGCILSVPDLTPNIGLFWYFFTEMFEHFRPFFLWVFQINTVVYALPLAFRFRNDPGLLFFVLASLIATFKSYPAVGDVAFYLALMPTWKHLFPYMRQLFIVGCVMVTCTVLAPVLWHLWIYTGSANSNFYFGITLAFNTAQIFLVTDILFAYIKREHYLHEGKQEEIDGKPARLELR